MDITFILPGYGRKPIGGFRIVYEYANGLAALGHAVTVVHGFRLRQSPQPVGTQRRVKRAARVALDKLFGPPRGVSWQRIDPSVRLLYAPNLDSRYIPEGDAIIATAWETAEYALEYPPQKGVKFYLIQHYETWSGPKERVDATWRAPLHKIVISKWLYDIGTNLGITDMVHIPNAIDHDGFRLMRPIEGRPLRVAMLYSSMSWKGAADGLAALDLAKKACPQLEAVLFGLERRPQGIPEWIEYIRNPAQKTLVNDIYNGSSIYLCPSWLEGWPLPPAEAMACGCCVVSTDNGGVRDYIVHNKTTLLSPPRDQNTLAANLIKVCQDESLRQHLAEAGNANIRTFTWDRSLSAFEDYLHKHIVRTIINNKV